MKRNTVQKQIILEAIRKLDSHPTVDEVYEEVHELHPSISKVTVYRDLYQLADNHDIQRIMLPGELARYDTRLDHHYHFKCKVCGAIFDINADDVADEAAMDKKVEQKYGFKVDKHDVTFLGICPDCQKKLST
jgi:Fe2+ or Zn2+ uptake regulation protein